MVRVENGRPLDIHERMNDPQFRSTTSSSPLPTWSGQEHQKHLLVVFVHGFKGDDGTFAKFPDRIQEILARTVPRMTVEAVTFPVYEARSYLILMHRFPE